MTKNLVSRTMMFAIVLLTAAALPARGTDLTPILPLDPPAVIGSSTVFPGGGWEPANLLDGNLQTEFAVAGQGVGTHVDFDFRKPVVVAGFKHVDRNDPATVRSARLIFSRHADFREPIASVPVQHADKRSGVTLAAFPPRHGPLCPLGSDRPECSSGTARWVERRSHFLPRRPATPCRSAIP